MDGDRPEGKEEAEDGRAQRDGQAQLTRLISV
jgi:hypothetical protein